MSEINKSEMPLHILAHKTDSEIDNIISELELFEAQSSRLDPVFSGATFGNKAQDLIDSAGKISFYETGCMINEMCDGAYIPGSLVSDILKRKQLDPLSIPKPATSRKNIDKIQSKAVFDAMIGAAHQYLTSEGYCSEVITDSIKPIIRETLESEGLSNVSIPRVLEFAVLDDGSVAPILLKKGEARELAAIDSAQIAFAAHLAKIGLEKHGESVVFSKNALVLFSENPLNPALSSYNINDGKISLSLTKQLSQAISSGQTSMHITDEGRLEPGESSFSPKLNDEVFIPNDKLPAAVKEAILNKARAAEFKKVSDELGKEATIIIKDYYAECSAEAGLESPKATIGYCKATPSSRKFLATPKVLELIKESGLDPENFYNVSQSTRMTLNGKSDIIVEAKQEVRATVDPIIEAATPKPKKINTPKL